MYIFSWMSIFFLCLNNISLTSWTWKTKFRVCPVYNWSDVISSLKNSDNINWGKNAERADVHQSPGNIYEANILYSYLPMSHFTERTEITWVTSFDLMFCVNAWIMFAFKFPLASISPRITGNIWKKIQVIFH